MPRARPDDPGEWHPRLSSIGDPRRDRLEGRREGGALLEDCRSIGSCGRDRENTSAQRSQHTHPTDSDPKRTGLVMHRSELEVKS